MSQRSQEKFVRSISALPPSLERLAKLVRNTVEPRTDALKSYCFPKPDSCSVHINIERLQYSLSGNNWLADDVLNAYTALLRLDPYDYGDDIPFEIWDSLFLQTIRSTPMVGSVTQKSIRTFENIFLPMARGNHWILLVIYPRSSTIEQYNSLAPNTRRESKQVPKGPLTEVRDWLAGWMNESPDSWNIVERSRAECPSQQNSYDCGFIVLLIIRLMAGTFPLPTEDSGHPETETLCNQLRNHIAVELIAGHLNPLEEHIPFEFMRLLKESVLSYLK